MSKGSKCEFCVPEIKFLGYIIGKHGRKVDSDKVVMEIPVLIHSNFKEDFILSTNALEYVLGAVLEQEEDDRKLHPVGYANKTLTKAEQKYLIMELECYAVVWRIEKFHHYLYRRK